MVIELQPPLTARNGHTLSALLVCRVSDPTKQDERSPQDQAAMLQEWLAQRTRLPCEVEVLAGSGSGECLDRQEYLSLIEKIESEKHDVVLTEDLGRIVRRIHAHLICEDCVDHGTRLISPYADQIDTAVEGWQDRSIFSAWHHERSNRDTSHRIKRAHRARFAQGGCLPQQIFGYRTKACVTTTDRKRTDADWEKVPEAVSIYEEWFRRLDEGVTYAELADWLNENNVPPGPFADNKQWNGPMVGMTSHNILLKGVRFRNKRKTRRVNNPGHYKSEKADPNDLLTRRVPHLAFFDEAYYDHVIAKADARNAKYRRNGNGGPDPCQNRPKKRTRYPGQTVYCGICGRLYVFGGHGQTEHLMCEGAREYKCWNGITFDGPLAARSFPEATFNEIEKLEAFDPVFLDKLNHEARLVDDARNARLGAIERELRAVQREIENVMNFIRGGDASERVRAEMRQLEKREKEILRRKAEVELTATDVIAIPSAEEVKLITRKAFQDLAMDCFEFAKRMRELTGKIYVYPFRLCEGTPYVLRAKLRLRLAGLLPDERAREVLQNLLMRELRIDLFNRPQRVRFRERVVAGRQECDAAGHKRTERDVARSLGITVATAQRAAALDRLMEQQGLTDPYVLQLEPPTDHPKLRRHLHPRYHFEPLPGHTPDW
jgi:site-specific DNA recombinase